MNLEDLKEALAYPTPREEGTTLLVIPDFILDFIKAAARAFLELQEDRREPDYDAAMELLNAEMRYYRIDFEFSEQQVEAIVDAALGRPPIEEER